MKEKVYAIYNKIANWFDQHRSRELVEKAYLDRVISQLKSGAKILDLGCGMAEPITEIHDLVNRYICAYCGANFYERMR